MDVRTHKQKICTEYIFSFIVHTVSGGSVILTVKYLLWRKRHAMHDRTTPHKHSAAFIVHCSCVAVSCSTRIAVSVPTTAVRYCS